MIDLFREWDDDESGNVSKKEFRRGMEMMGLDVAKEAVDELFDSWDPDGSGVLELNELQKQLRRGGGIELDASLQAGAAGEITLASTNKVALRKGKIDKTNSTQLQGLDLEEDSDKPVSEQARCTSPHTRLSTQITLHTSSHTRLHTHVSPHTSSHTRLFTHVFSRTSSIRRLPTHVYTHTSLRSRLLTHVSPHIFSHICLPTHVSLYTSPHTRLLTPL